MPYPVWRGQVFFWNAFLTRLHFEQHYFPEIQLFSKDCIIFQDLTAKRHTGLPDRSVPMAPSPMYLGSAQSMRLATSWAFSLFPTRLPKGSALSVEFVPPLLSEAETCLDFHIFWGAAQRQKNTENTGFSDTKKSTFQSFHDPLPMGPGLDGSHFRNTRFVPPCFRADF